MTVNYSTVQSKVSLARLNTFGFDHQAENLATAADEFELVDLLGLADRKNWAVFVLGSGSNVVLTRDIAGLVIRLGDRQLAFDLQRNGETHVTAGAGMSWHELVLATLDAGLAGLENLSLIPGTVGAAPVQNIGAYGVELADRLVSVRALHRESRAMHTVACAECEFAYRNSRFKRERNEWIITSATFALAPDLPLSTSYASLSARLQEGGNLQPDARAVSDAVIAIRHERLPDPDIIGNAGSFFHNPVVTVEKADGLLERYPGLVTFHQPDGQVKLAAGWMIDQLGYRGIRRGQIGVHAEQALVLVNEGAGTGSALLSLADEIRLAVRNAYDVELTIEPVIV